MKNMAYVSEQISENSVIEDEMWPDQCWKPYFYAVASHRGNVCRLKETESFVIYRPGKFPHLPNGPNIQNMTRYKSKINKTPNTSHPTTTTKYVFVHITHTLSCSQNVRSSPIINHDFTKSQIFICSD